MRPLKQLLHRELPEPIGSAALAKNGKYLLVGRKTLLSKSKFGVDGHVADLFGLSSDALEWVGGFNLATTINWYWSGSALILSPTGNEVLFYNHYVDVNAWKSSADLPYVPVTGMENVCPEPLDISPNASMALFRIRSLSKRDLDTIVIYDLATGEIKLKLPERHDLTGNVKALDDLRNRPTPADQKGSLLTACFLGDGAVALWRKDGSIDVLDIDTGHLEKVLPGPIGDESYRHRAQFLPIHGSPYVVCATYGRDGIVVVNWKSKKMLWKADGASCAPVYHDGKLLYQSESVWKQEPDLDPHMNDAAIGQRVLALRDVATGRLIMEYERNEEFDFLLLNPKGNNLWGVAYDEVFKYSIDLNP